MKTYRELEVGDILYVLTEELEIEKTVISRISRLPKFISLKLIDNSGNIRYHKYIHIERIERTVSLTTATNLKDIKKLKAKKVAALNSEWRRGLWSKSFFI